MILNDIISPLLEKYDSLQCIECIGFHSWWQDDRWICDIYSDYINVRRGPSHLNATDPEFINKFQNALYHALY